MDDDASNIRCMGCMQMWAKTELQRHCSNCFGCTGCEVYVCPGCGKLIVVVPIRPTKQGRDAGDTTG
jgi:hypothetical protein